MFIDIITAILFLILGGGFLYFIHKTKIERKVERMIWVILYLLGIFAVGWWAHWIKDLISIKSVI